MGPKKTGGNVPQDKTHFSKRSLNTMQIKLRQKCCILKLRLFSSIAIECEWLQKGEDLSPPPPRSISSQLTTLLPTLVMDLSPGKNISLHFTEPFGELLDQVALQ